MTETHHFPKGSILFINDFQYDDNPDNNTNKLIIILHCDDNNFFVISTKTTSVVKVPDKNIKHGCKNSEELGLFFFMFEKGRVVGEDDFAFDEHTFVHFIQNVRKVEMSFFNDYISNSKLKTIGKLLESELDRLLKCMIGSKKITRGIRKILEDGRKKETA